MTDTNSTPTTTFESIGGLKSQIQAVKEMILFPRMYKSLQSKFGMKAPKGVLFHGPPGTGKTLLASALANECSIGGRRVTFISRKGADILGSYLGESERQLRKVFENARDSSPAVIFFDEIDALAPNRNSLGRDSHDYSSIVSVLLTEMDGIGTASGCDIFVVGATNRIDSIDPALRRPGRFDRELRFTLPSCEERRQIIKVHTSLWHPNMPEELVEHLATSTDGHCGADLQAICSETLMCCLRRTHPGIADCERKMPVRKSRLQVAKEDLILARAKFVPTAQRTEKASARRLSTIMEPLFRDTVNDIVAAMQDKFPYDYLHDNQFKDQGSSQPLLRPRLLLTGSDEHGVSNHLAPAILHHFQSLPVVRIDLATLCEQGSHSSDVACIGAIRNALGTLPCILYLPDITTWWPLVDESTRCLITSQIGYLPENMTLMLLATANQPYHDMPNELQQLFLEGLAIEAPSAAQRERFFAPLILTQPEVSGPPERKKRRRSRSESSTRSSSGSDSPRPPHPPPRPPFTQRQRDLQQRCMCAARRASRISHLQSKDAPKSSRKAALEGSGEGNERQVILQRLVAATRGFPSLPLERAYGHLSIPCSRYVQHNDEERLLAELREVVQSIEQQGRDRAAKRDDDGSHGAFL